MANLLGGRAAARSIIDWRRGRYHPPIWAIDVLQEFLRTQGRKMLEVADQLEHEKLKRL
jgi:hypothetical protein